MNLGLLSQEIRIFPFNKHGARDICRDSRARWDAGSEIERLMVEERPKPASDFRREQYSERVAEQLIRLIEASPTPKLIGTYLRMLANTEVMAERERFAKQMKAEGYELRKIEEQTAG